MPDYTDPLDSPNRKGGAGLHGASGAKAPFRVVVSVFEGPIDLLLYLIRKNELNIHEIPLARIVEEYREYVDLITMIDLENAGDFIVIASRLLKIKAQSLFQRQEDIVGDEEEVVTRDSLFKYLMEFEKFEGVTEKLAEKEQERIGVFPRGGERVRISGLLMDDGTEPDYLLFDLLTAMRDVLKKAPRTKMHDVELLNVTSEMKQQEILDIISKSGKLDFIDFVTGEPKLIIVVSFIALLELIKNRKIVVRQSRQFGKIMVYARKTDTVEDN